MTTAHVAPLRLVDCPAASAVGDNVNANVVAASVVSAATSLGLAAGVVPTEGSAAEGVGVSVACASHDDAAAPDALEPTASTVHAIFDLYFTKPRHIPVSLLEVYHEERARVRTQMAADGVAILVEDEYHLQVVCPVKYMDQYKAWPAYRFVDAIGTYYIDWTRLYPTYGLYTPEAG